MKWMIRSAAIVVALAFAAPVSAARPGPETITMSATVSSFPTAPPALGSFGGTFNASGVTGFDSGSYNAQARFNAFPAPSTSMLETTRTLTGSAGATLNLRCAEVAAQITDDSDVLGRGTCAVLGGTGAYAALSGAGTVTSVANLLTGAFNETLTFPAG